MWWLLPHSQWRAQKGNSNRAAMRTIVKAGRPPGLLAYVDGKPAGWCAVAPRDKYVRLANSRILKPVDDKPVWAVTCFFVASAYRKRGLTLELLKEAVKFAGSNGAKIVEGYPTEPSKLQADAFLFTGLASVFRKACFKEVARRSPTPC